LTHVNGGAPELCNSHIHFKEAAAADQLLRPAGLPGSTSGGHLGQVLRSHLCGHPAKMLRNKKLPGN
jgi:hypothetical protein